MNHALQKAALQKLRAAEDVFPNDRAFLEAFIVRTDSELWEVIGILAGNDEDRAATEAGYLAYLVACTDVGKHGALPTWYDMKPSQYRSAKAEAVKKLRAAERELSALIPGLEQVSLLHMIWPDGGAPESGIENMDDFSMDFWGGHASSAVSALQTFYESHPDYCPTIAGKNGIIEKICAEVDAFEPRRYSKPKTGPAWPRHFVCQLFQQLTEDRTFAGLSLASKYRVIDSCLHFYAGWIGKQADSEGWTAERVDNAVTR